MITGRDLTRSTVPTRDVARPTRDLGQLLEQSVIGITPLISYCFNKFTRVPLRAGGAQPPAPRDLLMVPRGSTADLPTRWVWAMSETESSAFASWAIYCSETTNTALSTHRASSKQMNHNANISNFCWFISFDGRASTQTSPVTTNWVPQFTPYPTQ